MLTSFVFTIYLLLANCQAQEFAAEYGVDISWPMHTDHVSQNFAWLQSETFVSSSNSNSTDTMVSHLPDRQDIYNDYINGCIEYYGANGHLCTRGEEERISMSLRQPKDMKNYTDVGFKKMKAPPELMKMLFEFWERNKDSEYLESWPPGNVYTNHWKSPTKMVSVENDELVGGGYELKKRLWDAAKDSLEEWTGHKLRGSSLYGIRVYKEGSILSTHVDRMPLISSCIINVAQDVDEDWPIEVIGHDKKAHNITMVPGDMVLYESHSVLHGRPFALKGRYYANVFIHFEPIIGEEEIKLQADERARKRAKHDARNARLLENSKDHPDDLPPYIEEGSNEAKRWRKDNPNYSHSKESEAYLKETMVDLIVDENNSVTSAHIAAKGGDLTKIVRHSDAFLKQVDVNGWGPIHEAARGGYSEIVLYLYERGIDITKETEGGGTPKDIALGVHGPDHELVKWFDEHEGKLSHTEL